MVPSVPVVLALLAALLFAAGNNLQRHAAAADEHASAGPVRLLLLLLRNPRWLCGGACAVLALLFQAKALTDGGVILVQSVIATTLVFSLAMEALVERRWPRAPQLVGSVVVILGIVLLVGIGRPGVDGSFSSLWRAAGVLVAVGLIGGGALYRARLRPRGRRTAIGLGAAAGTCFALDAVFLRGAATQLSDLAQPPVRWTGSGVALAADFLTDPTFLVNVGGFAVASVVGNLVIARAFQLAPLRHVLPAMAAAEPLAAFVTGRFVFGERLAGGPFATLAVVGGLALMMVGVVLCARGRTGTLATRGTAPEDDALSARR